MSEKIAQKINLGNSNNHQPYHSQDGYKAVDIASTKINADMSAGNKIDNTKPVSSTQTSIRGKKRTLKYRLTKKDKHHKTRRA